MRKPFLLNWKFKLLLCSYGIHFQVTERTLIQISLYRNLPTWPSVSPSAEQLCYASLILPTCTEILSSDLAWYQETWSFDLRYQLWDLWSLFFEANCVWRVLLLPAASSGLLNDTGACTWHHLAFIFHSSWNRASAFAQLFCSYRSPPQIQIHRELQ